MAIRTYDILLDSYNSTMPEPIVGRQGDKNGAVTLHVTITDRGTAVDLTGQTINLMAETAKGTAIVADNLGVTLTDATNGKFDYAIPNALWSESGKITRAYFSLNDTDGQQTTYDLIFIVKKAIDIDQKHADDYVTIIDGTLRDLQSKVNAIYEAYNQGNFYNKSETDSKDAATLSSAEKYADSGDSNALHNAKTYTDNSLSGIVALPETFVNLAAIKAKYPNGKNGVMVAADNGHKYIWANGTWTDAGVYQSQGIAPGSITSEMLGIGVVKHDNIADKQVDKFKLADGAVVAGKIADGSVIDGNIAIGAVNKDNVKDKAITGLKLADAAVNTDNVRDKAITGFKLADAAVNTDNVRDKAITGFKLADAAVKFDKIGDKQAYGRKLKHEGRPCWAYSEQLSYNEAILIVNDGATDTDPGTVAFNPKATTIAFFFEDQKIMTTPDKIKLDTTVLSFTSKQAIYVYLDPATLTMYLGKVHNPADLEKLMSDCVYLGMAFPPYMADKSNNRIGIDWNGVFTEDIKRRPFGGMGKYIGPAITADFNAGSFTIPAGTRNVFCHPIGLVHPMNDNGTPNNDALTLPFDSTVYLQALLFNMRTGKFLVLRMNYTLDFRYSDYVAIAYADLTAKKLVLL